MAVAPTVGVSPNWAMPSRTVNTTTAVPSLNSDSPTMVVFSGLEALAVRSTPSTAIGSVGEIRAPNSRQYRKLTCQPNKPKIQKARVPITKVAIITPKVASRPMGQR